MKRENLTQNEINDLDKLKKLKLRISILEKLAIYSTDLFNITIKKERASEFFEKIVSIRNAHEMTFVIERDDKTLIMYSIRNQIFNVYFKDLTIKQVEQIKNLHKNKLEIKFLTYILKI